MPFLNDYIARCQSVLQAGEPANDVLVYWPIHDLWMDSKGLLKNLAVHHKEWIDDHRIGDIANLLDSKGYAFDFVSDRMLDKIRFQNGELHAPGGMYKVVLVPKCTFMPAATLKHLGGIGVSDVPVYIGRCGHGKWDYGFVGRIDDVMIWGRALTEVEVLGLWITLKGAATDPTQLGKIANPIQ